MAKFKLNFIHLCDDAIFSQDGKLSLIGIFEVINVVTLPGSLLKAYLVFNLNVLDEALKEVDIDISIKNVNSGKEVMNISNLKTPINKVGDEIKLGVTLQLVNIAFTEEGKHLIELRINKEVVGKLFFEVKLQIK
jgi:hypothetical protein